jgi:glutamyl-tRNA reductase
MNDSEAMRRAELERALRLLQNGRDPFEVLEALSRRLTNKLLHAPTRAVQQP